MVQAAALPLKGKAPEEYKKSNDTAIVECRQIGCAHHGLGFGCKRKVIEINIAGGYCNLPLKRGQKPWKIVSNF